MRVPHPQFTPSQKDASHIAEVIDSNSVEFLAECLVPDELDYPSMPSLGSWVIVADQSPNSSIQKIVAIVCWSQTGTIDSIHRPVALGLSWEELRQEQPQLFGLVSSRVRCLNIGFIDRNDSFYHYLPPTPPQLHQGVYLCSPEFIADFSQHDDTWLETLLSSSHPTIDATIAASLRYCYSASKCDRSWLVKIGRKLNVLLRDDYDRFRRIIGQVQFQQL